VAGTNPAFDAGLFRNAIRQSMQMGMPSNLAEQLKWHWKRDTEYVPQDPTQNPYEWTQTPVVDLPGNPDEPDGERIVDYAIEFSARPAGSQETVFGQFDTSRAIVTLLDTDYAIIRSADYCSIDGAIYDIDFSAPPLGMFEVTVYQVFLTARDEA
jgi:hypothetical protein